MGGTLQVAPSLQYIFHGYFDVAHAILLVEKASELTLMVVFPCENASNLISYLTSLDSFIGLVHGIWIRRLKCRVLILVEDPTSGVACLKPASTSNNV